MASIKYSAASPFLRQLLSCHVVGGCHMTVAGYKGIVGKL